MADSSHEPKENTSRCSSCRAKAEKKKIKEVRHEDVKQTHKASGDEDPEEPVNKLKENVTTETEKVQCKSTDSKGSSDSDEEPSKSEKHKNKSILTWRHPSIKKEKQKHSADLLPKRDCVRPPFYAPATMYGGGSYYPPYPPVAVAAAPPLFWHARPFREPNPMVRYTSYADNYLYGFF